MWDALTARLVKEASARDIALWVMLYPVLYITFVLLTGASVLPASLAAVGAPVAALLGTAFLAGLMLWLRSWRSAISAADRDPELALEGDVRDTLEGLHFDIRSYAIARTHAAPILDQIRGELLNVWDLHERGLVDEARLSAARELAVTDWLRVRDAFPLPANSPAGEQLRGLARRDSNRATRQGHGDRELPRGS